MVKGQTLFIRPIETGDRSAVGDFLHEHGGGSAETLHGIVGKLVGDLASVLLYETRGKALAIGTFVVRKDLRRKRIGTLMLAELERIAISSEVSCLEVGSPGEACSFFEKAGFTREGDLMVKRVNRAHR